MKPKLYLINGPLGAGKTTFLKELLKLPHYKDARIIENEFASTSIDTQQLHDHHAEVQTIAGVCICCSTGDELTDALVSLSESNQPVIIEATGVANSLKLIEKIVVADVLDKYDIDHAFFVLDGAEASQDIDAALRVYQRELEAADTVLVSKTDLLSSTNRDRLMNALKGLNLKRVGFVHEGVCDHSLLQGSSDILSYFATNDDVLSNHDDGSNYTVISLEDIQFEVAKVGEMWTSLGREFGLRRLKGDIYDENNRLWHIEATPAQCRVTEGAAGNPAQLICIGTNARALGRSTIEDEARKMHG